MEYLFQWFIDVRTSLNKRLQKLSTKKIFESYLIMKRNIEDKGTLQISNH